MANVVGLKTGGLFEKVKKQKRLFIYDNDRDGGYAIYEKKYAIYEKKILLEQK